MHHHNCNISKSAAMHPLEPQMKLASSASEQNVYFTYVCLLNEVNPTDSFSRERAQNRTSFHLDQIDGAAIDHDDEPIQVERSKALHELVESYKKHENEVLTTNVNNNETDSSTPYPTTSGEDSELSENDEFLGFDNPNVLKLTKMKWLSEEQTGTPDSSSPSLSPVRSTTSSYCSLYSEDNLHEEIIDDKYLSTILRLDKEHNLFGLSSIAVVGSRQSRKIRKEEDRPVFHQTAIVQVCCAKGCCRHRTKSDYPASLKCGGCRSCTGCPSHPSCLSCASSIPPCTATPPCPSVCSTCPKGTCSCRVPCAKKHECTSCFGVKIKINRKPKYEDDPVELTPRSSCVLSKPFAARSCHHLPRCVPPSSCFPYLMPCFWPARPSAPCPTHQRCFHNPPCLAARKRKSYIPPEVRCSKTSPVCETSKSKTTCPNIFCPGKNKALKKAIEERYGKGAQKHHSSNTSVGKSSSHGSVGKTKGSEKKRSPK